MREYIMQVEMGNAPIEHEVNFDEDFFCKWGIEYEIYKNQC